MSATFRNKLAAEIATNVSRRSGGGYFNYGTIKIKRERWSASIVERINKLPAFSGNVQPFFTGSGKENIFYKDFAAIGKTLIDTLIKNSSRAQWEIIKGTKLTPSEIIIKYKRKPSKGDYKTKTVTPNTSNIEKGVVDSIKKILKKLVLDKALEYVHGRSGTGQFDQSLFRSKQSDVSESLKSGEQMELGQGTNVDQAIARAIDENIQNFTGQNLLFQTIVTKYNDIFGYEHDVKASQTKDYFKRTLVMRGFIDPKDVADNAADYDKAILEDIVEFLQNADEAAAVEIMKRLKKSSPEDWKGMGPKAMGALWSNSPNILDSLDKITKHNIIQGLFGHKVRPDLRLKVNKKLIQEGVKEFGVKNSSRMSTPTKKSVRSKTSRPKGGSRLTNRQVPVTSPLNLRNLLNDVINEAVGKNMISPRLRYRTGRFANSVEITNVAQKPRGGLIIDYTYQKDPYQTFEKGGRMGSPERDPRDLIGTSIREVAQQLIGKKFIQTRRV